MATEINFNTQRSEMIGTFDNPIEQPSDINLYSSFGDWRFWELPVIQPRSDGEIFEPQETFDINDPSSSSMNAQYLHRQVQNSSNSISSHNASMELEMIHHYETNSTNPDYSEYNTSKMFSNSACDTTNSKETLSDLTTFPPVTETVTSYTGDSLIKRLLLNSTVSQSNQFYNTESNNTTSFESIKQENEEKETTEENNKCEVCFAKAGKHNYYGGNVCTSCRGFFRRSVQSKQYPLFVCNLNENNNLPISKINIEIFKNHGESVASTLCTIDSKSRKSCKHCRFLRCISRGMRPGWVLSDEDRMRRLLQRNRKQQRHQMSIKRQITLHFTQEERQLVEKLKSLIFAEAYSAYYETFGEDLEIFRSYVNAIYYRQPIKYRVIKKIENIDKRAMIEKGFHLLDTILDVSKIHSNLKQALVKHNNVALFGFYWAVFCEACDMEEFMSEFMSYGLTHRNGPGVESLLEEMGKLNLRDKKSAWAYDMMYFSPWAPSADIEERHQKLTRRICMWPRMKAGGENKIDRSQLAILTMILLLSQDGIRLEDSSENLIHLKAAEENQTKFVMMLHRYLKDKHMNEDEVVVNASLANGLMIVSQAKELHEMHSLMLPI